MIQPIMRYLLIGDFQRAGELIKSLRREEIKELIREITGYQGLWEQVEAELPVKVWLGVLRYGGVK